MTTLKIGSKQVAMDEIFNSPRPTRVELARFYNTLGLTIHNQLNSLEAIQMTAEATSHPWIVALMSEIYTGIQQGEYFVSATHAAFKKWIGFRIAQLNERFDDSPIADPELFSEPDKNRWDPAQTGQWAIPDFFGVFADFLLFIEAGENCGDLDDALARLREITLNHGVVGCYDEIWGRDVSLFCVILEQCCSAGMPVARSLKVIQRSTPLHQELDIAIRAMDEGTSLAEALERTQGKLAHPTLVSIIGAAEESGEFELCLIRLQNKQKNSRHLAIANGS